MTPCIVLLVNREPLVLDGDVVAGCELEELERRRERELWGRLTQLVNVNIADVEADSQVLHVAGVRNPGEVHRELRTGLNLDLWSCCC